MTLIEKTVFLKSVEVLSQMPSEALAQLAARAGETRCDRGQVVFREGDEDQGTFFVVEGLLELTKNGVVVRRLRPSMAHGELFLGENERHQYTAIAREDSLLLNLPRADVVEAILEYPEFSLGMVQDLARRLHKLTQRLIELDAELKQRVGASDAAGPVEAGEAQPAPAGVPRRRGWWRRRRPGA